MKRILILFFITLFFLQCSIFKPSSLDPTEDLGSLQSLLRLLSLADAFNTQSQTVLFMKFTDANGTPYANGSIEYSVFNEADENGIPVSPFGNTGNVATYTSTLDSFGRGFLFFSERGFANVSLKDVGNNFVGFINFRVYNGLTKQLFKITNQSGNAQFILEDLANYRNRLASNLTFTSLGSANGRQFIYLTRLTSNIAPDQNTSIGYIASSADGENYDLVTQIDGVTIETNVTYEKLLKISKPVFNGFEYVFFLSEETRDYSPPNNFQTNRNFALRIPAFFTPSVASVTTLTLDSDLFLFRGDNFPWMYPVLYFGNGRYLISPKQFPSTTVRPILLNSVFTPSQDLISGFSCLAVDINVNSTAFQLVSSAGTEYLQCPTTGLGNQIFGVRSIEGLTLNNRAVNFDAGGGLLFQSPTMFVRDQFIGLVNITPALGHTFSLDSYNQASPTILKNTPQITNFNASISASDPLLRSIKSSANTDYFILSNNSNFAAPTIQIFRSIDSLSSVSVIPTIPTDYSVTISNAEQLQSANGLLNYSYPFSTTNSVGTFPVYFTRFTKPDGTWEDLPRLIKIR